MFSFFVSQLDKEQELIENINAFLHDNIRDDVIVFYENLSRPKVKCQFVTSNAADAWNYKGPMIATNLTTANKLINFPFVSQKFYYMKQLEWMNIPNKNYETLTKIYQSPELKIVVDTDESKGVFEECWIKPVLAVIENYNMEKIKQITK